MEKRFRLNEEITAPKVHLIMEDGQSAGVVSLDQARYLAEQYELDLAEINSSSNPPIAKLIDYNKYRYQQEKQARQGSNKNKSNELKEMRLSFRIDEHDLATKAKRASEFLEEGHFVRVFVMLRGRENVFPDKAKGILQSFQDMVGADVEQPITHVGNRVQVTIKAKRK